MGDLAASYLEQLPHSLTAALNSSEGWKDTDTRTVTNYVNRRAVENAKERGVILPNRLKVTKSKGKFKVDWESA